MCNLYVLCVCVSVYIYMIYFLFLQVVVNWEDGGIVISL